MSQKNHRAGPSSTKAKGRRLTGNDGAQPLSLEEVYATRIGSLTRFLSRFLDSRDEIEDVLHDAFLKSFEAERKVQIKAPTAFVFRTARNIALNVLSLRRRSRTEPVADLETLSVLYDLQYISTIDPESQLLLDEQLAQAEATVESLTPRVREVFVLRKVYGLSHQEIAERLGISISTVEKHIVRGTLEMRRRREGEGSETASARIGELGLQGGKNEND